MKGTEINLEDLEISLVLVEGILVPFSIEEVGCKIDAVNFIHVFRKEAEKETNITNFCPLRLVHIDIELTCFTNIIIAHVVIRIIITIIDVL